MNKLMISIVASVAVFGGLIAVSSTSAHATAATCVNPRNVNNLTVKWTGKSTVTVATKDGKTICNDQVIYLSSFVMPAAWDGNGFNETAMPQTVHKSVTATLKATTAPKVTLTVAMPEACKNVQTDVYYGPEQTSVTTDNKIGIRLISAQHLKGTGTCGEGVQPAEVLPAADVTELPETGISAGLFATIVTGLGTYAVAYRARKQ